MKEENENISFKFYLQALVLVKTEMQVKLFLLLFLHSTGASDRRFYPIFNQRFEPSETLLTICRPKTVLSFGSLRAPLVLSPQSKFPQKRTFMLPLKHHASVSNILAKPLNCFMENKN